jgi:hypothetical protein
MRLMSLWRSWTTGDLAAGLASSVWLVVAVAVRRLRQCAVCSGSIITHFVQALCLAGSTIYPRPPLVQCEPGLRVSCGELALCHAVLWISEQRRGAAHIQGAIRFVVLLQLIHSFCRPTEEESTVSVR